MFRLTNQRFKSSIKLFKRFSLCLNSNNSNINSHQLQFQVQIVQLNERNRERNLKNHHSKEGIVLFLNLKVVYRYNNSSNSLHSHLLLSRNRCFHQKVILNTMKVIKKSILIFLILYDQKATTLLIRKDKTIFLNQPLNN